MDSSKKQAPVKPSVNEGGRSNVVPGTTGRRGKARLGNNTQLAGKSESKEVKADESRGKKNVSADSKPALKSGSEKTNNNGPPNKGTGRGRFGHGSGGKNGPKAGKAQACNGTVGGLAGESSQKKDAGPSGNDNKASKKLTEAKDLSRSDTKGASKESPENGAQPSASNSNASQATGKITTDHMKLFMSSLTKTKNMYTRDPVPLDSPWSFWVNRVSGDLTRKKYSLQKVTTVYTIKSFWEAYENIPRIRDMANGASLHFMRDLRRPIACDPVNVKGGVFRFTCDSRCVQKVWKEFNRAAAGELFNQYLASNDEISGISVEIDATESAIQIWNVNCQITATNKESVFKGVGRLLPDVKFNSTLYNPHFRTPFVTSPAKNKMATQK